LGILLACVSSGACAWNYEEHKELGNVSYTKACELLLANEPNLRALEAIASVACSHIGEQARQYGVRTGLAGDHVKSPETFLTIAAEVEALSWASYGHAAIENYEHFWPHVKDTWRRYQQSAIDAALKAGDHWRNNRKDLAVTEFNKALIYSSFADHFLQDAFSAGHSGYSRINSLQNPSLIFHDYWNKHGRWMKGTIYKLDIGEAITRRTLLTEALSSFKREQEWYAYGDGELSRSNDEATKSNVQNKEQILQASTASIVSVILAFAEGNGSEFFLLADSQTPNATEYFQQLPIYFAWLLGVTQYETITPDLEGHCVQENTEVYEEFRKCWFDLENSFAEPTYPDLTVAVGRSYFVRQKNGFNSLSLAYSPYSSKNFPWWPRSLRIYALSNLADLNMTYRDHDILSYTEYGFNWTVPNYLHGSIISNEIDLSYASLSENTRKRFGGTPSSTIDGLYAGLNTNLDLLRAKLTLGLGAFVPTSASTHKPEYKAQLTIGWSIGVIGGGPLTRWRNQ
jgi:hypothetical protein